MKYVWIRLFGGFLYNDLMKEIATKIITAFFAALLIFTFTPTVQAEENNKFGIHIIDEHDLKDAAALINSSGGQWGYVTMVIREDQRDQAQWQRVFDEMRRLKLIPIVRIATKMEAQYWSTPSEEEANDWAEFLNSLIWPIKNRYVVLFNEPNHAKEWGGAIDPAGYAKIYRNYYETLKHFSEDFFVLPAALDLAADGSNGTMEPTIYFQKMHEEDEFIFTLYDGLNSHSYPNPGFRGKTTDTGRESIKGYKWELSFLSSFGLSPNIPIFITETGWINGSGDIKQNYKYAFENVWSDPAVKAVTPFVLSYLDAPFNDFSWKDPKTGEFYPQYYSVQSITKEKGEPKQETSFELISHNIADYLVSESEYSFSVEIKNTGQSIWDDEEGFKVVAVSTMNSTNVTVGKVPYTEPKQVAKVNIRLVTNEPRGIHTLNMSLHKNDEKIGDIANAKFTLVSPPSLNLFANFWLGRAKNNFANLDIYDQGTQISSFENIAFENGQATIAAVKNVIPNKEYSFVLSKPFHGSSVRKKQLYVGLVDIDFGRLLPIDLNGDGQVNLSDLLYHFKNPLATELLVLPL